MEIKYEKKGKDRKELVNAISDIVGEHAKYLGAPTFAYNVGSWYTVTKDGNLNVFDRASSDEVENLIEQLAERGFEAISEIELAIEEDEEGNASEDEYIQFSIGIPINDLTDKISEKACVDRTVENLKAIIASKKKLFQKSIGTENELTIVWERNKLYFDWFDKIIDKEHLDIYTTFIKALYKMAENAVRVNAKEKNMENEKFAMRTFLNRLGLSGTEHKALRKELLRNLDGNSAFRYGQQDKNGDE
nr:MAG TPA: hypothetical protein [Caudoviricetes sp.]